MSVAEAVFLTAIGVPPIKSVLAGGIDLVPILEIMPWCTLGVLDRKFGVKIPLINELYR